MSFVVKAAKSIVNAGTSAVSGVVKAVGSVVGGVVKAVGQVASAVVNFVVTPFLGLFGLGAPDMPDTASPESLKGVLVQTQGSDVNVPIVYGHRKVGGTVVFAETGSDTNKYFWVAYVFSEGPVQGLREVWIDDIQIPASNMAALNAGQMVTVSGKDAVGVDCKFNKLTTLQFYSGLFDPTNPAIGNVGVGASVGIFKGAPSWKTSMNYNGLCTMFARYEWPTDTTNNPFSGSVPKLQVTMLGRKIASLVDGTPESYDYKGTGYSERYSSNPAEIVLDYLRNPYYGKGLRNSDIDWASFKAAAAKCNQQVEYITGVTGPILDLHYVADSGQTIFNNTKDMLSNFRAYLPYSGGKYKLLIEDAGDPYDILSGVAPIVATFDKDNIQGDITYTGIERSAKYNQVVVHYTDPDNQWSAQSVTYPETEAERNKYYAIDGYRENKAEFTFKGLTNYAIAKDMARLAFNKSRWQDSLSLTVSSQGFELDAGDNVYVDANILKFGTDPNAGAIPWRIVSIKLNNDYTFSLGLVRNPDFIYPHIRVGEIDYKYAAYVPKGASRYYPQEPIGIPVGLRPPTTTPSDPTDPTNPTSTTGVGALVDEISFYALSTASKTDGIYITAKFLQPNNSAYAGVTIKYKQNLSSVTTYTTMEVNTLVGAGGPITVVFGPLLNNTTYRIESQVKYITGDRSTKIAVTGIQVGVPSDGSNTGGGGVTVPPPVNLANDYLSSAIGMTQVSGGHPLTPRKVTFTLTQDISAGINGYLNGLEIFYKPSANPKWYRTTQSLIGTQGSAFSFDLTFGTPLYPNVPGSGGVPATADNWDFIFRFTYSDGKTSMYQYRALNCSIEYVPFTYNYNILASAQGGNTIYNKELTSTYVPQVAGPNDIVETRNMALSILTISNAKSSGSQKIYFGLGTPVESDWVNWIGARLYYYKVTGVGTPAWSSADYTPVTNDALSYYVSLDIDYDAVYEYVLVPLVNYGGNTVEAFQGRYISGKIHNRTADTDYPSNGNWAPSMTMNALEDVATAKSHLGTATAAGPRKDTKVSNLTASTVLTSSHPSSPRKVSFTLTQNNTGTANGRIKGIKVLYKLNSYLYWKESVYAFPTPYIEGTSITFDSSQTAPAMDLGYPSYPTFPGIEQLYDFRLRFVYDNDEESDYESTFVSCKIEDNGISTSHVYSFNFIGPYTTGNTPWVKKTDITNLLEKNQPPGTVTDIRNITDNITAYQFYATTTNGLNSIYFWASTPQATMKSYLAGFKVERREVIPGTTVDTNPVSTDVSNFPYITSANVYVNGAYVNTIGALIQGINWDTEYEYIITPQVWYNGSITDATKAFYWKGKVHNRTTETSGSNPYPSDGNWFSKSTCQTLNYQTAIGSLNAPYPDTNPVARLRGVTRVDATTTNLGYHNIQFQVSGSTTDITIYRRSVYDVKQIPNIYYNAANTFGAGWWESFTLTSGQYTIDSNNVVTVNLRPAISGRGEFQYNFDPTAVKSATNTFYKPYTNTEPTNKFLVGDTTQSTGSPTEISQILIVLNYNPGSGAVTSNQGLLVDLRSTATNILTDAQTVPFIASTSSTNTLINPVPVPAPASANLNAMKKTISEARTRVTANIKISSGYSTVNYTTPTATPGVL